MDEQSASVQPQLAARQAGEHWDEQTKAGIVDRVLAAMEVGESLDAACIREGVNPGTCWEWLNGDKELQIRYEGLKIARSRALVEHVLFEIEALVSPEQARIVDVRVKTYLRVAALLNPKEFSDKVHAIGHKQGPAGRVSFNLTFNGTEPKEMGQITVIEDNSE